MWNSLLSDVQSSPSQATFKSRLKTHLFNIAFNKQPELWCCITSSAPQICYTSTWHVTNWFINIIIINISNALIDYHDAVSNSSVMHWFAFTCRNSTRFLRADWQIWSDRGHHITCEWLLPKEGALYAVFSLMCFVCLQKMCQLWHVLTLLHIDLYHNFWQITWWTLSCDTSHVGSLLLTLFAAKQWKWRGITHLCAVTYSPDSSAAAAAGTPRIYLARSLAFRLDFGPIKLGDWCRNVCIRRPSTTPATWISTSLTLRQALCRVLLSVNEIVF